MICLFLWKNKNTHRWTWERVGGQKHDKIAKNINKIKTPNISVHDFDGMCDFLLGAQFLPGLALVLARFAWPQMGTGVGHASACDRGWWSFDCRFCKLAIELSQRLSDSSTRPAPPHNPTRRAFCTIALEILKYRVPKNYLTIGCVPATPKFC